MQGKCYGGSGESRSGVVASEINCRKGPGTGTGASAEDDYPPLKPERPHTIAEVKEALRQAVEAVDRAQEIPQAVLNALFLCTSMLAGELRMLTNYVEQELIGDYEP
jgi:hypothetical protein